jgi:hypothetical protein
MSGHVFVSNFMEYNILLLLFCWTALGGFTCRHPAAMPVVARVPVVVELFTSEGCSSCPAADAALRELEQAQSVPGVEIIALGEHVDYWNRLGWRDTFSSPQYTERQRRYAASLGTSSYTPQAVVNGRYELVGSQRVALATAVAQAAQAPQSVLRLTVQAGRLQAHVSSVPVGTPAADIVLLITESGLESQVGRGENQGRLLRHAAVVRELRPLGRLAANGTFSADTELALYPTWQVAKLKAVVLVQEVASRRIVGAASAKLL